MAAIGLQAISVIPREGVESDGIEADWVAGRYVIPREGVESIVSLL